MKTLIVGRGLLAVAFFAAWGVATGANAGVFRAFLSSTGNDANPCSLTAPCRLLPAALAKVVDGGRITLLDSANYNTGTVTITQSVTIDANPGGSAGVAAINGDAIYVNTPGVNVTLRNLVILNYGGGTNGIEFAQGAQLNVENCEISNMGTVTDAAIVVTASGSNVTVKNTELRNNYRGFRALGTTNATLDSVNAHDNGIAIGAADGAHVTVTGSAMQNNGTGIEALSLAVSGTVLVIAHSTISGSGFGIAAGAKSGLTAEVFTEANILHIGYGFYWHGSGGTETIYSSGDNRLVFYNASTFGGTLQSLPGI